MQPQMNNIISFNVTLFNLPNDAKENLKTHMGMTNSPYDSEACRSTL